MCTRASTRTNLVLPHCRENTYDTVGLKESTAMSDHEVAMETNPPMECALASSDISCRSVRVHMCTCVSCVIRSWKKI